MKEFGASPFGGDLSKWPSKIVDAFSLLQQEDQKVNNLMMRQSRQSSKKQPIQIRQYSR